MPILPGEPDQGSISSEPSVSLEPTVSEPTPQPSAPVAEPDRAPADAPADDLEAFAAQALEAPVKSPDADLEEFANQELGSIDAGEEEDKKLAVAFEQSFNRDPKEVSRVMQLEKMTGLPSDFIEQNRDDIEKEVRGGSFNAPEFRARSPKLATWLAADRNRMALAQKDLGYLGDIEKKAGAQQVASDMWDSLGSGLARMYSGVAKIPGSVAEYVYTPQNMIAEAFDLPSLKVTLKDNVLNNSASKYFDRVSKTLAPEALSYSITEELGKGNWGKAGEALANQFIANAPTQAALLIGAMSGVGTPALVGAGLLSGAESMAEGRELGAAPIPNAINSLTAGMTEATFERLGTFGLFDKWQAAIASKYGSGAAKTVIKDFAKTMFASGIGEANEEFMTSVAQDASSAMTGVNPEAMTGSLGRALDAGIIGGASGGAMTGPAATITGYARVNRDQRAKVEVKRQQDFFTALEGGKDSETYKNSPEEFQAAVNAVTGGTPMKEVRIDSEAWDKHFFQKGEDPRAKAAEVMEDDGKAYDEAKEQGTELVIPTGNYAAKIIGTDNHAALSDEIRTGKNRSNAREIRTLISEHEEKLKSEASPDAPEKNEVETIREDIELKLRLAMPNVSKQDAKAQALVMSKGLAQMAKLSQKDGKGKTVLQIYNERGFKIYGQKAGIETHGGIKNEEAVVFSQDSGGERPGLLKRIASVFTGAEDTTAAPEAKKSTPDREYLQKELPDQSRTISPLGFYSAVEDAVSKMDFNTIPPKDLAGRITNLQGIKKDELEFLGLTDFLNAYEGKISKEQVLDFIKKNGLVVEQIVLSEEYKQKNNKRESERDASNLPTPDDLEWDEGELQEPDSDYISENVNENMKEDLRVGPDYRSKKWIYDLSGSEHIAGMKNIEGTYYGDKYIERFDELTEELQPDYTDDEGTVDEDGLDQEIRKELKSYVDGTLSSEAYENEFQSYMDNDGHGSGHFIYKESETGWTLQGNDDNGEWYSPDTRKNYTGNIEEAKIQIIEDMVDEGMVSYPIDEEDQNDGDSSESEKNADGDPVPEVDVNTPSGSSKWENHTVPGGKNYREFLITMPKLGPDKFKYTTHFDQENIAGFARVTDRVDSDGKRILFIEELQSDWHQQGREKGYATLEAKALTVEAERLSELLDVASANDRGASDDLNTYLEEAYKDHPLSHISTVLWRKGKDSPQPEQESAIKMIGQETYDKLMSDATARDLLALAKTAVAAQAEAQNAYATARDKSQGADNAVPDAPLQNTEAWAALVLKRMIRLATEQGYDGIAWTPGEIHSKRWGSENVTWVKKKGITEGWVVLPPDQDKIRKRYELREQVKLQSDLEDKAVRYSPEWDTARQRRNELEDEIRQMYGDGQNDNWRVFNSDPNLDSKKSFDTEVEAQECLKKQAEDHWLVGSINQRGGTYEGQDIEELARSRGQLLERSGERVTTVEELRAVVASAMGEERKRAVESVTEATWKQMQENVTGLKQPRKEGLEFFYNNMLAKKAAPAVLKGLDKKAKVSVSEIKTGERTNTVYRGPDYTPASLRTVAENIEDETIRERLENLADKFEENGEGRSFAAFAANYLVPRAAEALGAELVEVTEDVTLKSWSISLTPEMKDAAMKGMALFQKDAVIRGQMRLSGKEIAIDMMKDANRSTFLHEMAHAFLEIFHDLQNEPDAPAELKGMFKAAAEWFASKDPLESLGEIRKNAMEAQAASEANPGNARLETLAAAGREAVRMAEEGGADFMREVSMSFGRNVEDEDVRAFLVTPLHEYWARGFEAYLRDGKAPSVELRSAFRRFRKWLLDLYKTFKGLRVELSPEIRKVYDQLLASEEEITEAEADTGMNDQLIIAPSEILNEADAARYSMAVEDARAHARERLDARVMADIEKEQTSWWNEEREKIKEEIASEVNLDKVYVALAFLGKGAQADGSPLPAGMRPVKVSKKSIVDLFGEGRLKLLPRPYIYTTDGGEDVEELASFFDYGSADEMLTAMTEAEDKDALIERAVEARMQELHGDKALDGKLPQEALAAIHSENQAKLLQMELEFLTQNKLGDFKKMLGTIAGSVPSVSQVREKAEETMRSKPIRDIQPITYQRAEKKAAKAAVEALTKGDVAKAFEEKRRQLLNHELYRAAVEAKSKGEKAANYAHNLEKPAVQARVGKAGGGHLEAMNAILERFNFKTLPTTQVDRLKSIAEWANEQIELGVTPNISDQLMNDAYRKHYKDMTYGELMDVREALKQIEHIARTKNKLLGEKKAREFGEVKAAMISSIKAHHKMDAKPEELHPSLKDKIVDAFETFRAKHTRIEVLTQFLDGLKESGPVWQNLFRPFARAGSKKTEMIHASNAKMKSIMSVYTDEERAQLATKKMFIKDFGNSPKLKPNFTKVDMLVVALNWGNEDNRKALLEGYGWSEDQVNKILSNLESRDWAVVQGVWDHIDSFWPEIAAQERKLLGIVPGKVVASPFVIRGLKGGVHELKGGYYPIKFDSRFSKKEFERQQEGAVQDIFGGNFVKAATKRGHTKERVGSGGQAIKLDLGVLAQHLTSVIQDLTHRVPVMDAMKIVGDKDIYGAIEQAVGRQMARQFQPWLVSVAGSEAVNPADHYGKFFSLIKKNSTMVFLGFKFTSALVQFVDIPIAAHDIGMKWLHEGLKEAYFRNKISDSWAFASERSEHMRNLIEHKDRDVREFLKKEGFLEGASMLDGFKEASMIMAHTMDSGIALMIWTGAYHKALSGALENVQKGNEVASAEFADGVVRTAQMAGEAKDEADIQRGSNLWKLATQFYSPMSVAFNQMQKHMYMRQKLDEKFKLPQFLYASTMLIFMPVILESLIKGKLQAKEGEDEEAWMWHLLESMLLYIPEHMIGVRDLVRAFTSDDARTHFSPSPAFSAIESVADATKGVAGVMSGDKEADRKILKQLVMAGGYMGGMPVRQFWLSSEYAYDWMTGEENPGTPLEGGWRTLVIGKPKK